jgi:N utilization substance protein B
MMTTQPNVGGRSAARLAAVQALYQIEFSGASAEQVIGEFVTLRLGQEIEGVRYAPADPELFADVVHGYHRHAAEIDAGLEACLEKARTLLKIEAILRAILRAGATELKVRSDVPAKVVIDEYLDVAHAFFGGTEAAFINGILDRFARQIRPHEFPG